ncbi:MAG: ABC transporter ATP-binding protein [Candidatus Binatia bacterium]|nr:ABC transporter ATP-binding protein [Candidatus Binatia bacterium]
MIRFAGLHKSYGDLVAVDRLTFEIPAGQVFGFIGRNGAGKTTTIKMMMGLLEPTKGTVSLGGFDIQERSRDAKAITGYLPDHPYLYDKLTGREFLGFVAGLYGVPERERESRSEELLGDFALLDRAGELTETYSHGMKQRLALAAALVHRPKILVLDEPMVGLDPQGAQDFQRLLQQLAAEGVSIFLSTHSLSVAEALCDAIGVLDRGRLIALGTLEELRSRTTSKAEGAAVPVDGTDAPESLESVFLDLVGAAEGQW